MRNWHKYSEIHIQHPTSHESFSAKHQNRSEIQYPFDERPASGRSWQPVPICALRQVTSLQPSDAGKKVRPVLPYLVHYPSVSTVSYSTGCRWCPILLILLDADDAAACSGKLSAATLLFHLPSRGHVKTECQAFMGWNAWEIWEQSYLWMVKHGQTVKSCQIMSKLAWGDRLTIDVDKAVFWQEQLEWHRPGTGEDIVLILRHFSDPARPPDDLRKVDSVCLVDSKASHPQQRYIEKRWALKTFSEPLKSWIWRVENHSQSLWWGSRSQRGPCALCI